MNAEKVMRQIESMGTEQNRKIYKRHGAGDNLFGVSFANLKKLKKQIKTDHGLAQELWATGNTDAQTLATMIADPFEATEDLLDRWAQDIQYYCLADVFVRVLVSRTPFAKKKAEQWSQSAGEFVGQAGWDLVGCLVMTDKSLPDSYFEPYLAKIETTIHSAKNRTKHAMGSALIAIGIRNEALQKKALAAAKRIGKVEVDHGETNCKTPDAVGYILKAWKHKQAQAKKR